jgi:hypothetical protein
MVDFRQSRTFNRLNQITEIAIFPTTLFGLHMDDDYLCRRRCDRDKSIHEVIIRRQSAVSKWQAVQKMKVQNN